MKVNKFIILTLVATLSLVGCMQSSKAGNDSDRKTLVLAELIASSNKVAGATRDACYRAVLIMNQCIGAGYGFNTGLMCGNTQFDEAAYNKLATCAATQVQTTYCNFPQNRVADPRVALTNFFSSCQQTGADNTSKIIIAGY